MQGDQTWGIMWLGMVVRVQELHGVLKGDFVGGPKYPDPQCWADSLLPHVSLEMLCVALVLGHGVNWSPWV